MRNILVPVDFSTATPHVLDVAGQLAKSLGADIHLVHVQEIPPAIPPIGTSAMAGMPELMPMSPLPLGQPIPPPIVPNESEKEQLAQWQNKLRQEGVNVTAHNLVGDVSDEILRTAEAANADLIVMGRHSHGAMYNLLVGSVTEAVLKRSRWSVLLVPETRP
jgi:nucleotide-binding universal stress UspA family protein